MQIRAEPIDFTVDNQIRFVLEIPNSICEIHLFTESPMCLEQENNKILLSKYSNRESINALNDILTRAINGQHKLHKSINKKIGYLRNQYLHDSIEWNEGNIKESPKWDGDRYHLFSTPGSADINLVTWLYNNKHGDIIFEITRCYKWFFKEPDPSETYVSYDEFMNNYKSLYTATIPFSFAKTLLKQLDILLNQSKKNEEKHISEEI